MPETWLKTPWDILDYIGQEISNLSYFNATGEHDLSLVWSHWACKIYPQLFCQICLTYKKDVTFFIRILQSQLFGWLAPDVTQLVLESSDHYELSYFWRCLCGPLDRLLPNINRLECCGLQAYFQASSSLTAMWPWLQRYSSALQRLLSIKLSGYRFHFFTTLLRQLAAYLKSVEANNISWREPCNIQHFPRCKWMFHSIRNIYMKNCTEYWPFVWIAIASGLWNEVKLEGQFALYKAESSMLCGAQLIKSL